MNLRSCLTQARAVAGILHGSRAFGGPYQASVQLTNRCNIRCLHCYYHSPFLKMPNSFELRHAKQNGQEITPERIAQFKRLQADPTRMRKTLDALLSMGTRRFQFSGNGEPFIHPDAMEFIARVKRAGAYANTNTNGTLLGREEMDALLAMQFDDLRISVLAGDRATYARTHAGSDGREFVKLCDSLAHLFERRRTLRRKKPAVSLSFVIFAQNHSGIEKFARFVTDVGADHVIIRIFDDVDVPEYAPVRLTEEQTKIAREQLVVAREHFDRHGVSHNIERILQIFHGRLDTMTLNRAVPCYYAWLVVRVDVDGKVYPCCRCYTPLGDTACEGMKSIWFGKTYRDFRGRAIRLRELGGQEGCDCAHCVHHNANVRVFSVLHPFKSMPSHLRRFMGSPGGPASVDSGGDNELDEG